MSDHDAFIRAILARPEDDGPRLQYADFLRDEGEWDRAEFIEVQCELARTKHTCQESEHPANRRDWVCANCGASSSYQGHANADGTWYCEPCPACHLRRREQELWPRVSLAFREQLGDMYLALGTPIVRRGFIEEIQCEWQFWQRHASEIRAATPLRKVRLTTEPFILRAATIPILTALAELYPGIEFELPPEEKT